MVKLKLLIFLSLLFLAVQSFAQDSLATIYFYKPGGEDRSFSGFNLNRDNKPIGRIMPMRLITFRSKPGQLIVSAANKAGSDTIRMDVNGGEWYYVHAELKDGKPYLEKTTPEIAERELIIIDRDIAKEVKNHAFPRALPLIYNPALDSMGTIYFYRTGNIMGFAVAYNVKDGQKVLGRIKPSTVFFYRCKSGLKTFTATTEGTNSITLEVKSGEIYFVECGVGTGAFVGNPNFRQVSDDEGRKEIGRIYPGAASFIPTAVSGSQTFQQDTLRGIQNLYHRKRRGGSARSVIFGTLGIASLLGTANSSGGGGGEFIFVGFSAIMVITGLTQSAKYSPEKAEAAVAEYRQGKPLSAEVKRKMKKKDFK